ENCLAIFIIAACVVTSLVGLSHGIRMGMGVAATNNSIIFDVLKFGAVGDGKKDDTQAFTKAWTDVCNANGNTPTLLVPQGHTFLLNPITFMGPCKSSNIHVEIHGNIVAPNNIADWGKCDSNMWLRFSNIDNLIALSFNSCNNLQLSGLTHKDSPGGHISIGGCNNSTISNIKVVAPGDSPNTDGIDISSTSNLIIRDSVIGTGDDCIAIGTDSSFINITNIICGPGHGISVGSLGVDGSQAKVEQIHVKNCTFSNTANGARIKTWQGGSGYAKSITYEDINLIGASNPIIIDQYYCIDKKCNLKPTAVAVTDVKFINFHGTSASLAAINLNCSQAVPCSHVVMQDITITSLKPSTNINSFCGHVADIQQSSVAPPLKCTK
ncbi:hypothetical protein RDABS01_012881, partial [Bienertia sinuspersici]